MKQALAALLFFHSFSALGLTSYHIGNSLTWDSRPMWADEFNAGNSGGWHAQGGQSLTYMWNNPGAISYSANPLYGNYPSALPGHAWDAVVLQPYQNNASPVTILDEQNAAVALINLTRSNPANSDTVFYLFAPWPKLTRVHEWEDPFTDSDLSLVVMNHAFFDALKNRIESVTDVQIRLVPTGDVLFEIKKRIESGLVPGVRTNFSLYRDFFHLTYDVGRYIASATLHATLNNMDPAGFEIPPDDPDLPLDYAPPASDLYQALNEVIWEIVSAQNAALQAGDTDGDGDIDDSDLGTSFANYTGPVGAAGNKTASQGDTDGDGDVDDSDLGTAFANYTGPLTPSSVPEPTSLLLLAVGGLFVTRRR